MGNPLMGMAGGNPMQQMMQGNPIMQLISAMKNGGNAQQFFQQMAGQNPQAKIVFDMMNAGNTNGLKEMAMNMAKERGISIEDMTKQLGINMPK